MKLLIFIVAYNAETTIEPLLERIPVELQNYDTEVLVIDDEPDIRELLLLTLTRMGLLCDVAASFQEGISYIDKNTYFLVLTDMRLPDGDGYDIVQYIQKNKPGSLLKIVLPVFCLFLCVHLYLICFLAAKRNSHDRIFICGVSIKTK